jgi:DNA-binding CsgD family transcriptional regulator
MLQGDYLSVLEATDLNQFRAVVIRFAQQLGFETVTAVVAVDRPERGEPEFVAVHNTPLAFEQSFEDLSMARRDPVMQHCKRQTMPIMWSQKTYLDHGAIDLWDVQAQFGYRNGIAMSLHLPEGRHFTLGVDRAQTLPIDSGELTRMVADLQLFAVHAQDAALRVLIPETMQPERPALTPRELDVLRWTLDGKTAWEAGVLLGISERTTVQHLQNAMRKLQCNSKHQAALKALRLGLIH